ncbi:hypothetical protein EUX98_g1334 [Antrodiella citrinella]|uniref:NADP-dependent oxidoreductase domain-containing protein n=1 Tax=Antrodiella citrinella TaxID=2447956 RepID=A0A4V3XJG1_9APHY|nr:hypothetical protein EUX98_g1334 [Antrodiella citrinella]
MGRRYSDDPTDNDFFYIYRVFVSPRPTVGTESKLLAIDVMSTIPLTFQSTLRLSSGNDIPRFGFGVAFGFGKDEDVEAVSKPSALEALKVGYRHIDTAQKYRNEALVGEAIKESGVKREDIFITSKVPADFDGSTFTAVDDSLKAMGLDYLDLYLIHNPTEGTEDRLRMWKGLLEAKQVGKTRSVGVSNYNVHHLEEIKSAGLELPSINQIELHPLCQQRPIVDFCNANGIVVQAYCPIIQGHMDQPVITSMAKKHGRDPAHILLRWSLQRGFLPLIRSTNPARILSNTQIYDFELSGEEVADLSALDKGGEGAIAWNPINVL